MAHKKNQRLAFIPQKQVWNTYFDKSKWDKIIYNLISNAIKFTPQNGAIQVNLFSKLHTSRELIVLEVKDTGIGIENSQLNHIFNRFYQKEDNSSTHFQEGTGIGLSLVRELVELQGGTIHVESKVGMGTIFYMEIPVLKEEKIKKEQQQLEELEETFFSTSVLLNSSSQKAVSQSIKVANKLELLLVEDNSEIREYIRYCIDQDKYNIIEAADGTEGIQKAITLIPDLIVSDIMMPKKDGYQLTKAIRNNIQTSHIPIVLLTAKSALKNQLKGYERGADAYLTKPFSPQELALRIDKLIESRQMLQSCFTVSPSPRPSFPFPPIFEDD